MTGENDKLQERVERQVQRMQRAKRERPSLLAQSVFMGTLALIFVLPLVIGAYLGNWLDGMSSGYSFRWTIGLMLAGLAVGIINVYLYIRERR